MKFFNSTTATFAGFLISFVAIIVNALVLANINNRIGAADAENSRLNQALREQTDNGNEAETKFQSYRTMYHLASIVPPGNRASAQEDATVLLNEALTFLFAAANEVSVTEIRRVEAEIVNTEEAEQVYEQIKAAEEADKKSTVEKTPTKDEKQEHEKALEASLRELETPDADKRDLPKKIAAVETISIAAAAAESDNEFFVRLFPVNKALSARWVESVRQKQARLVELEAEKRQLIKYQGYSTLAALGLQMLGLMFVILKDVLKIKEDSE